MLGCAGLSKRIRPNYDDLWFIFDVFGFDFSFSSSLRQGVGVCVCSCFVSHFDVCAPGGRVYVCVWGGGVDLSSSPCFSVHSLKQGFYKIVGSPPPHHSAFFLNVHFLCPK